MRERKSLFDGTHTSLSFLKIVAVMDGYQLKGMLTQSLTLDFIMRHVRKTFFESSLSWSDVTF